MEKRTDNSILQELEIKRELLGHVRKRKLSYFGHLCRDHGCHITKTVVEGYVEGRRRRGRPRKQYIDNIGNSSSVKRWWPTITRDLPKRRSRKCLENELENTQVMLDRLSRPTFYGTFLSHISLVISLCT